MRSSTTGLESAIATTVAPSPDSIDNTRREIDMKIETTPCFRQGWERLRGRERQRTRTTTARISATALVILGGAIALTPTLAAAESSVEIGSHTFYCQNMCVVGQNAGGMYVEDSLGGWVRIYSAHGRLPVPR